MVLGASGTVGTILRPKLVVEDSKTSPIEVGYRLYVQYHANNVNLCMARKKVSSEATNPILSYD
jgi:hypothetical protein